MEDSAGMFSLPAEFAGNITNTCIDAIFLVYGRRTRLSTYKT